MPPLTERVQVLCSQEQVRQLKEIAELEGSSVGELIRRAVEKVYLRQRQQDAREAVRRMAVMSLPVGDWEQMKRESVRWSPDE